MGRFGLYWYGLGSFAKFLHLVIAIALAVLLFLLIAGDPVHADGYGPSQAGYKDEIREERYRPVAYRSREVRDYLTSAERRELKRIHAKAVARRDGRRLAARYDEPTRVRYVERRNAPSSLYVREGGRRCQSSVKATGEERGTMARALRSAQERWRATVIDDYGYGYANLSAAIEVRTPAPAIIRYNKFGFPIYVAHIRARPCKDL